MSDYLVRYEDSLWKIAEKQLGNPLRWKEIADLNHLDNPDMIFVGQPLKLPTEKKTSKNGQFRPSRLDLQTSSSFPGLAQRPIIYTLGRSFFFMIADEFDPFTKKVVRKVVFPKKIQNNPLLVKQVMNPDKFGFFPIKADSKVSIGRHVLGMTDSNFVSASELMMGSPLRKGKRYWIDVEKVLAEGGSIYNADDIVKDLERIAAKTKDPERLEYIKNILKKSLSEKEVLIEGYINPKFIKTTGAMIATKGLQFFSGVGIVLSAYDLGSASKESYEKKSVKPVTREVTRQVGGWGGAILGAKLGSATGALCGIETGPGVVLTTGIGGIVGGIAGFFGAEWVTQYLQNEEKIMDVVIEEI